MPNRSALPEVDPRSTLPMGGHEQKWVSFFTQLLSNPGLGLDDPTLAPLDLLIRSVDHFVFTLVRYKRNYKNNKGDCASPDLLFRVLITHYRELVSKQPELCSKEHLFVSFHNSLTRSHYNLD